jgi:hypothetical protein
MVRTIRSYLDTWKGLPVDRQELVGHLRAAHKVTLSSSMRLPSGSLAS